MLSNSDLKSIEEIVEKRIAEAFPIQNANKKMLSKAEVASIIGVSETTINRYLKAEKLHKTKWGGKVYIHRLEVENFIKKG